MWPSRTRLPCRECLADFRDDSSGQHRKPTGLFLWNWGMRSVGQEYNHHFHDPFSQVSKDIAANNLLWKYWIIQNKSKSKNKNTCFQLSFQMFWVKFSCWMSWLISSPPQPCEPTSLRKPTQFGGPLRDGKGTGTLKSPGNSFLGRQFYERGLPSKWHQTFPMLLNHCIACQRDLILDLGLSMFWDEFPHKLQI